MTQFVTKKRKTIVSLPELRTTIYQPNRVTNACYDYTLIQERIFNYVMWYLQEYILQVFNGTGVMQLDLFKTEKDIIIPVQMSTIVKNPNQYKSVRESARQLASIVVTMKGKNHEGDIVQRFMGLFSEVQVPIHMQRSSEINILLKQDVAKWLLHLDRNKYDKGCQFTSFTLEIANTAKNKYTSRLYKKVSSYKERDGFFMTLDDFREWLQLDDSYKNFNDIKRRILVPVMEELKEKADCWFHCADDKMVRNGKKIVAMWFKVIVPETQRLDEIKRRNIEWLLETHFKFKDYHYKEIESIFLNHPDYGMISHKIFKLRDRISENPSEYPYPQKYVIKALLAEFTQ